MSLSLSSFFFFNDTATTEIYTLSLHDALPICDEDGWTSDHTVVQIVNDDMPFLVDSVTAEIGQRELSLHLIIHRSEEHTSELQSRQYLVCRLLLEKKKNLHIILYHNIKIRASQ